MGYDRILRTQVTVELVREGPGMAYDCIVFFELNFTASNRAVVFCTMVVVAEVSALFNLPLRSTILLQEVFAHKIHSINRSL